jgi:hypothetical protein
MGVPRKATLGKYRCRASSPTIWRRLMFVGPFRELEGSKSMNPQDTESSCSTFTEYREILLHGHLLVQHLKSSSSPDSNPM